MSILGDLESGESHEEPTDQDWASIRLSLYGLSDLPARIDALTEAVNAQSALISQRPADKRSATASIETRLDEIEKTLASVLGLLDGSAISESTTALSAAADRVTKATASSSKEAKAALAKFEQAAEESRAAAEEVKQRGVAAVRGVATRAVQASVEAVAQRDEAAEKRAARVIATAEKLDAGRIWATLASAGLVLVPFVLTALLVVLGGWAVGLGWHAIVDPDAGPWARGAQVGAWTILIVAAAVGLAFGGVWASTLLEDARDAWRKKRRKKEKKQRTT